MDRGGKSALLASCLVLAGCASATNGVQIKPVSNAAERLSRGSDEIGLARAQLLLGNVGLALEAFRKAQRENPSDVAPLTGIGDCYAAMGRFDIAQSSYEAALAISPHDPSLLLGLAAIFEREGKAEFAMAARAEARIAAEHMSAPPAKPVTTASALTSSPAAQPTSPAAQPTFKPVVGMGSVTVDLPPARPAGHVAAPVVHSPALTPLQIEPPRPELPSAVAEDAARQTSLPRPQIAAPIALSSSVTAALPTPRMVSNQLSAAKIEMMAEPASAPLPPLAHPRAALVVQDVSPAKTSGSAAVQSTFASTDEGPRAAHPRPILLVQSLLAADDQIVVSAPPSHPPMPNRAPTAQIALEATVGPRLERVSPGEVVLVTTGKPIWHASESALAATSRPRWVALGQPARPIVQVLNAARSQGLAASARNVLSGRGWREIAIGDASAVRRASIVLYPKSQASLGRRLAAQFQVMARMSQRDNIVLLLGRDSVHRILGQRRS